jgi:hypothetical protein
MRVESVSEEWPTEDIAYPETISGRVATSLPSFGLTLFANA